MNIKIEICQYNEKQPSAIFQKLNFESIEEAIATVDFMKMSYDNFRKGDGLIVRLGKGHQAHLIDFDSEYAVQLFRKELEKFYGASNYQIQPKSANSNFVFKEDENTKYASTTTGERLPFKLYHANEQPNFIGFSQSEHSSDFALLERRFAENKSLEFVGSERIDSHNDIAWLFKSLEDEAIEHGFLVYHFEDKGYFVQHLSTGTFDQTFIDGKTFLGNVLRANPKSVTLVHNHPSGTLVASKADFDCLSTLKKALKYTDISVNDGIIINLRSGKYLVFDDSLNSLIANRKISNKPLHNIPQYSFSKQVYVENFQPITVNNSEQVAEYISSQKFGISDKTEMLVLNAQMHIVGKFIMPPSSQVNFIIDKLTQFGGVNCILYGNNITPQEIDFYNERLKFARMHILDGLLIKSDNAERIYTSFMANGMLNVNKITTDINNTTKSNEMANLTWLDKVLAPKTKAYKDFITKMQNTPSEQWFQDGERVFNEKEKKYLEIYNHLNEKKKTHSVSTHSIVEKKDNRNFELFENLTAEYAREIINANNGEKELYLLDNRTSNEIKIDNNNKEEISRLFTRLQEEYETTSEGFSMFDVVDDYFPNKEIEDINLNPAEYNISVLYDGQLEFAFGVDTLDKVKKYFEKADFNENKTYLLINNTDNSTVLIQNSDEKKFFLQNYQESETGIDNIIGTITIKPQELVGGTIKQIAEETIKNPKYIKQFDKQTQHTINLFIKTAILKNSTNNTIDKLNHFKSSNLNNPIINPKNQNSMETNTTGFDQLKHLQNQLKYLGFGESEALHKDLEAGLNSNEKQFEIKTTSDKTLPGNKIEFAIKFKKSEQGVVFLNSYNASLTNAKGENISNNFPVTKDNSFTAKEAINLLEGRAVKNEFINPKTNEKEFAFVKLNFEEGKNQYDNYNFQTFYKNYGVDVPQIVDKSNLIFDNPEYKETTIASLEKGNIVKVKFEQNDTVIEGKAVLNPQYKNLSLYDANMNRINTNKPFQGVEQDNAHEKGNVREQSKSRGI